MRFSDSNNDNPISFIQYPDITTYILQHTFYNISTAETLYNYFVTVLKYKML